MNHLKSQIVLFLALIGFATQSIAQERVWQDSTGTFSAQAELLEVVDDTAVLKKSNGVVIRVPLAKLSNVDRDYLAGLNQPAKPSRPQPSPALLKTTKKPAPPPLAIGEKAKLPATVSSVPRTSGRRRATVDGSHIDSTDVSPPPTRMKVPNVTVQPETNAPLPSVGIQPKRPIPIATVPPVERTPAPKSSLVETAKLTVAVPPIIKSSDRRRETLDAILLDSTNIPRNPTRSLVPTFAPEPKTFTPSPLATAEPAHSLPKINELPDVVLSKKSEYRFTARKNKSAPKIVLPAIEITDEQLKSIPYSHREIVAVLNDGSNAADIRMALDNLRDDWPADNETILKLVRKSTLLEEKFCRLKSMHLLGKFDAKNSFPFILARLDDSSFQIRWEALDLIGATADTRAIEPLVERFSGPDRPKISTVLISFGSRSEPLLFKHLRNPRSEVRMETSLLLGKLGTETSIPVLEEVSNKDPDPIVVMQAKSAIREIKKRLGDSE